MKIEKIEIPMILIEPSDYSLFSLPEAEPLLKDTIAPVKEAYRSLKEMLDEGLRIIEKIEKGGSSVQ